MKFKVESVKTVASRTFNLVVKANVCVPFVDLHVASLSRKSKAVLKGGEGTHGQFDKVGQFSHQRFESCVENQVLQHFDPDVQVFLFCFYFLVVFVDLQLVESDIKGSDLGLDDVCVLILDI